MKYEEENNSFIIEDFPHNIIQIIVFQSIYILSDNLIILKTTREKSGNIIYNKIRTKIKQEESNKQIENKKQDEK